MPELPETETLARDLSASLVGRVISRVDCPHADVLRNVSARALAKRLPGLRVERVWRRAKAVVLEVTSSRSLELSKSRVLEVSSSRVLKFSSSQVLEFSKSRSLEFSKSRSLEFSSSRSLEFSRSRVLNIVVVPRFTGGLLLRGPGTPDDRYDALRFRLDDDSTLAYRDVRRLGTVTLFNTAEFGAFDRRLGHEPLDPAFTPIVLSASLKSSQPIKKVLMDQRRIAGIGNIYANEALWAARIDPSRPARTITEPQTTALHNALVDILSRAIAARGTTFRDYRDANGQRGGFVSQLVAYGRGGEPCVRCSTRLTMTHAIDGRATVFCHRCQR